EEEGGEEISRELVVARGDAAEMLEFVEEALDEVALTVDREIDDASNADVGLARDMGCGAAGLDQIDDGAGEEAAIGDHVAGQAQPRDQRRKGGLVGGLTGCQEETDRQAMRIHDHVDLAAQSSTRTADGVIRAPFLPPAACWWARTIELSIKCSDCGEWRARAS